MMQIQEIAGMIDYRLDIVKKYMLSTCETEAEKTTCMNFMKELDSLVKLLHDNAVMSIQTLSHIISEYFDGEYVMSGGDVVTDFENMIYFIDVATYDDGSVVLSSHREEV